MVFKWGDMTRHDMTKRETRKVSPHLPRSTTLSKVSPAHSTSPKPPAHLGEHIRERRTIVGIKQAELGQLVGVHRATIGALESGKTKGDVLKTAILTLGCVPPLDPEAELAPAISAAATRVALAAIITASNDDPERLNNLATSWRDLVIAAAQPNRTSRPAAYEALRRELAQHSPAANMAMLHDEILRRFPQPPDVEIVVGGDQQNPSSGSALAALGEQLAALRTQLIESGLTNVHIASPPRDLRIPEAFEEPIRLYRSLSASDQEVANVFLAMLAGWARERLH
jgi:DNA-binding XRE family transcriptional regulator